MMREPLHDHDEASDEKMDSSLHYRGLACSNALRILCRGLRECRLTVWKDKPLLLRSSISSSFDKRPVLLISMA